MKIMNKFMHMQWTNSDRMFHIISTSGESIRPKILKVIKM